MTRQEIVVRQSPRRLLRGLLLTFVFFVPSALLLGIGILDPHPLALVGGGLGVAFSGPILLILLHALVQPSYLRIDDWGVTFRFYSVELAVPWENIREVSGGVGWPSLTFYDPDTATRAARFRGFPPPPSPISIRPIAGSSCSTSTRTSGCFGSTTGCPLTSWLRVVERSSRR